MYSKDIVVNCLHCEADLEVNRLASSMQCPFCDKKFNIEEGKKAREIIMKNNQAIRDHRYVEESGHDISSSKTSEKVKYCRECGRKLAYDAKYCDWCGVKVI